MQTQTIGEINKATYHRIHQKSEDYAFTQIILDSLEIPLALSFHFVYFFILLCLFFKSSVEVCMITYA